MIAYADTSFIVALFAGEAGQWSKAWKWWHAAGLCQVMVSRLTLLEAENAFHSLRLDRKLTGTEFRQALNGLAHARMEALLVRRETPAHRLYPGRIVWSRIIPPVPHTARWTLCTSPRPSFCERIPSVLSTSPRPLWPAPPACALRPRPPDCRRA